MFQKIKYITKKNYIEKQFKVIKIFQKTKINNNINFHSTKLTINHIKKKLKNMKQKYKISVMNK